MAVGFNLMSLMACYTAIVVCIALNISGVISDMLYVLYVKCRCNDLKSTRNSGSTLVQASSTQTIFTFYLYLLLKDI